MTLQEAVKSGKPFRHKEWTRWFTSETLETECITMKCAISDDWEIQQKETFTREDVERAVEYAVNHSTEYSPGRYEIMSEAMKAAEGEV